MKNFLVELLTEELPPKSLAKLGEAFANVIVKGLQTDGLVGLDAKHTVFATPRRLGVWVESVADKAADKRVKQKVLPVTVALDATGQASPALAKKLAAMNLSHLSVADFTREMDGKAEAFFAEVTVAGKTLQASLQAALLDAIAKLPIAKAMTYQLADGDTTVQFVRPAHRLLALHGAEVVALEALGLKADRITEGHRFQGAKSVSVTNADTYEAQLDGEGGVIGGFAKRRAEIETQLKREAGGLGLGEYADLLDEVTALVEKPTVYRCAFEPEFLAVPQECLILTMRTNQKYFPLFDAAGKLREEFLIVSNMRLTDASKIIEGNQRVVRPRLADARFFFETDKKTKLIDRVPELAKVVYHGQLGTQGERIERLQRLAAALAPMLGADATKARHAAGLMKADLVTLMVGEFPELQGTMGRTYALNDGEAADVAAACDEHYKPRFAGDSLPSPGVPTACALADKLETLAGLFGIGQLPTGDKDPFALRRHALGVLRIVREQKLATPLSSLLNAAFAAVGTKATNPTARAALTEFIVDRLRGTLRDEGFTANEVEAVLAKAPDRLDDLSDKLAAVRAYAALPEAESLSAANKRVANILRKAEETKEPIGASVDAAKLVEPAEQSLANALKAAAPLADAAFTKGDFTGYLKQFAALRTPVDAFFNDVMVMADDKAIRANRLALLRDLREAMNRVADLSKLAA